VAVACDLTAAALAFFWLRPLVVRITSRQVAAGRPAEMAPAVAASLAQMPKP
jgi:hypothetical protein